MNELSAEEVDKLFSIYKVKLSHQMVKSLGKLMIRMMMGTIADGVAFSFLFSAGLILAIRTVVIMDRFVDGSLCCLRNE